LQQNKTHGTIFAFFKDKRYKEERDTLLKIKTQIIGEKKWHRRKGVSQEAVE
jgi:hypothetical protein